ncbi:mucin-2 isoform X2 [Euwallacea fornicatus]|uniref:mucin-2 isoform X2 n=1 Tax=Euwallacea fornicatus TaxID=995702 RepID=UPI00338DFCD5
MKAWTQLIEPGPALATLCIAVILGSPCFAAPAQPEQHAEQSTEIEYYPVADATGCYYNFQHYDEGDRIITNEPCLNCTCHNRMLMCYLKVCPFTKAIGANCKVEKKPDQCCPVITCPEVPVQLVTSTAPSTALGHLNEYGCSIDNLFYSDGARVPSNPDNPCELCYCIRNKTACVMQECTLNVEGCRPVFQEGVCCPVRYNCEHPEYLEGSTTPQITTTSSTTTTTTTETPTTTLQPGVQCEFHGDMYNDGELVKKDIPCEKCYCLRGDIVCAVQECGPTPLDKVNCTALPVTEGQCCPDTYNCTGVIEEELTTLSSLSFETKPTTASPKESEQTITEQPLTTSHVKIEEYVPEISPGATEAPKEAPETATKAAKGEETNKNVLEEGDKHEKQPTTPEAVEEFTKQPVEATQPTSHKAETTKPVGTETLVTEQPMDETQTETVRKEAVIPEVSVTQPAKESVTDEKISPTTEGPIEVITTRVSQAIDAITSSVTGAMETITTAISSSTNEPSAKQPGEKTDVSTEESLTKITTPKIEEELSTTTEKAEITSLVSETEKPEELPMTSEKETPSGAQPSEIPPEKEPDAESTATPDEETSTELAELPDKETPKGTGSTQLTEKEVPKGTEPTQLPEKQEPTELPELPEKQEPTELSALPETPEPTELPELPETDTTEQIPITSELPTEKEKHSQVFHDKYKEIETKLPTISEPIASSTEKIDVPEVTTITLPTFSEPTTAELTTPSTRTEPTIVPEQCDEQGCARIPATSTETPAESQTTKSPSITEVKLETEVPVDSETTDTKQQSPSGQPEEYKTTQAVEEIPDKSTDTSSQPFGFDQSITTEEEVVIVTEIPTKKTELPQSMDHVSETAYSTDVSKEIPGLTTEIIVTVTEEVETQRPISVSQTSQQTTERVYEAGITKLPSDVAKPSDEQKTSHIGVGSTTELPRTEENEIDLNEEHSSGLKTEENVTVLEMSEAKTTTSPKQQPITVPSKIGKTPENVTEKAVVPEVCTSELECAPVIPSVTQTEQPSESILPSEENILPPIITESNKIPEEPTEETNEIEIEPIEKVTETVPETEGSGQKPTESSTEEKDSGQIPPKESAIIPEIPNGTERAPPTETPGIPESPPTMTQLPETTEYPGPTTLPEREIPGEGSCLVDGQTYKNNSAVPPINHCQAFCRCISSILRCESIECSPPPVEFQNCIPVFSDTDSCCPTYSCTEAETKVSIEDEEYFLQFTTPTHKKTVEPDITTFSPTHEKGPEVTSERITLPEKIHVPKDTEIPEVTEPGLKDTEAPKEKLTEPALETTEILQEGVTKPPHKTMQVSKENMTELATEPPKEGVTEHSLKPTAIPEIGPTKPSETSETLKDSITEFTTKMPKEKVTELELEITNFPHEKVTEPSRKSSEAPEEDMDKRTSETPKEGVTEPALKATQIPSEKVSESSNNSAETSEEGVTKPITETPKEVTELAPTSTEHPKEEVTELAPEAPEEGVAKPATKNPEEPAKKNRPVTDSPEGFKEIIPTNKNKQNETQTTEAPDVDIPEDQVTVHSLGESSKATKIPETISTTFSEVEEETTTALTEKAVEVDERHEQISSPRPETDKKKEATTPIGTGTSEMVTEVVNTVTTEGKSEDERATTPVAEIETEEPKIIPITTVPETFSTAKVELTTPQQEKEGDPQIPYKSDKKKPEEKPDGFKEGSTTPEAEPSKGISKEQATSQITEKPVEHVTIPEETFTHKFTKADSHVTEQQQAQAPTEKPSEAKPSQTLVTEEPTIIQPSATEPSAVTELVKPPNEQNVTISETEIPDLNPTEGNGLSPANSSLVTNDVEITDRAPLNKTTAITSPAPSEEVETSKTPKEVVTTTSAQGIEIPVSATSEAQPEQTTVGAISSTTKSVEETKATEVSKVETEATEVPEEVETEATEVPKEVETEAPGVTSVVSKKPHIKPISVISPDVSEAPVTKKFQTVEGATETKMTPPPNLPSPTQQPEVPEETTITVGDAEIVTTPVPTKEKIASSQFKKEGSTEAAYKSTTALPEKQVKFSGSTTETPSEIEQSTFMETDKLIPTEPEVISKTEKAKDPTEEPSEVFTQSPIEDVSSQTEESSKAPVKLPEPSRTPLPEVPGEGQTEQPKEEIPIFTSPAEVTSEATIGAENVSMPIRVGELFTSGPEVETTSKKHVFGELSTSILISESTAALPATTSTELPPAHILGEQTPEPPDYEQPGDYYGVDEHNAFGPGTCRYGGKVYVSAQQIPRDDPCDFCFCFRSDIICLQQSCPPPIPRCHEEPIRGFCCPRYECPVSMSTAVNVTTSTTTTTTTLPPHFFSHAYKGRASKTGCQISGKAYQVGEVIDSTSGPCLYCICGGDGQMKCDPKPCSPEPMIQQMIAAAALRRRR